MVSRPSYLERLYQYFGMFWNVNQHLWVLFHLKDGIPLHIKAFLLWGRGNYSEALRSGRFGGIVPHN